MSTDNLRLEVRKRWDTDSFIETGVSLPDIHYSEPWIPYETYMKAQLITAVPGQQGLLLVDFPPQAAEDNDLHIHPLSDRVITIIAGSGTFLAIRKGKLERFDIYQGYRVWMPRGIIHTFLAGEEGLLVESIHNPFIPFDDPTCLVYSTYHKNQ